MEFSIRDLEKSDNGILANIIRASLVEFVSNLEGTVYYDDTTDALFELFETRESSRYFVVEGSEGIVGGAGVYPSDGLPNDTMELVKMYLSPQARGKGLAVHLLDKCVKDAKEKGLSFLYIETISELERAISIYEKYGFKHLNQPLGNTGHFGCDVWMILKL